VCHASNIVWTPFINGFQFTGRSAPLSFGQDMSAELDALMEEMHLGAFHEQHMFPECQKNCANVLVMPSNNILRGTQNKNWGASRAIALGIRLGTQNKNWGACRHIIADVRRGTKNKNLGALRLVSARLGGHGTQGWGRAHQHVVDVYQCEW